MKLNIALLLYVACASMGIAQEVSTPPAKTVAVGTQRVGDLIIQGTVTPTWYVPGAVVVAAPPQVVVQAPPSRVQSPVQQVAVVGKRTTSDELRRRIETLGKDIESAKREIADAKVSLVSVALDEQRTAQEQVVLAQRRLEELRQEAERAEGVATAMRAAEAATSHSPEPVPAEAGKETASRAVADVKTPEVAKAAATPAQPAPRFELRRQDRSIAAAMTRWAESAGYRILWEVKDEPASYEDQYEMPFPEAVDKVMQALRIAGKDVKMCEYTNPVIRVIPGTSKCKNEQPLNLDIKAGAQE